MGREKCEICGNEIQEGFMGKIVGTIIKVKKGDVNKIYFVCSSCQKEFGNNLKEKLVD